MIFIANDEDYGGYVLLDVNEMMDTRNNGRLDKNLYLLPVSVPVNAFKTGKESLSKNGRQFPELQVQN